MLSLLISQSIPNPSMQLLKTAALSLGIFLAFCGCSAVPKLVTDGRVTIQVPHNWKVSKAGDGHILIETNFVHPLFSDAHLATGTISIHSEAACLSDNDMTQAKSNAARSLFSHHPPTASWFEVKTGSASLSCLINEKPAIGNIPNDLMFCKSQDGLSVVFIGRSSVRQKALEILKSVKTTVSCTQTKQ